MAAKTNPAKSAAQYREAQAVLHGTARSATSMTKKVAKELIDATPAKLRSAFMKRRNPNQAEFARLEHAADGSLKSIAQGYGFEVAGPSARGTFLLKEGTKAWLFGPLRKQGQMTLRTVTPSVWSPSNVQRMSNARKPRHARRKNFLGFGGSKTTFSSKLSQDAYDAGYKGTGGVRDTAAFEKWYSKLPEADRKTHHGSMKAKLRAQFEKGVKQEHADHLAGIKSKVAELKQEKRSTPKPSVPATGEHTFDQYKGLTIKRNAQGMYEVKGETWNTLAQAKQYADFWVASGGKIRRKTNSKRKNSYTALPGDPKATQTIRKIHPAPKFLSPRLPAAYSASGGNAIKAIAAAKKVSTKRNSYTHPKGTGEAELRQGNSRAQIFETGTGKHTAQIITGSGGREEHSFSGPGSFRAAMSWARLRLHEVANPVKFKVYPLSKNRRKNPAEPAARMYEKFHGTPSTEVREYIEEVHRHAWLAGLGPLVSIDVRSVQGNKDLEAELPRSHGCIGRRRRYVVGHRRRNPAHSGGRGSGIAGQGPHGKVRHGESGLRAGQRPDRNDYPNHLPDQKEL